MLFNRKCLCKCRDFFCNFVPEKKGISDDVAKSFALRAPFNIIGIAVIM